MKVLKKIFKNPYIQTLICGILLLWIGKYFSPEMSIGNQLQVVGPIGAPVDINQTTDNMDSPEIHFSNSTFKESHPGKYGSYPYIVTDGSGQLNMTSQSDTFYGTTHTVMQVEGSSTVNWSSTSDQFGK